MQRQNATARRIRPPRSTHRLEAVRIVTGTVFEHTPKYTTRGQNIIAQEREKGETYPVIVRVTAPSAPPTNHPGKRNHTNIQKHHNRW
jgi:hypothetical protein